MRVGLGLRLGLGSGLGLRLGLGLGVEFASDGHLVDESGGRAVVAESEEGGGARAWVGLGLECR